VLEALVGRVVALVAAANRREVEVTAQVIGDRPAGAIPRDHPLVQLTARALEAAGVTGYAFETGSTDANVPLSRGLPCVCLGLTRGANSHRPDEYIETRDVPKGLASVVAVVRGAFTLPE
jgi:di/tripeptidase